MINRLKRVHSMTSTEKSKRDLNRINAILFYEPNDRREREREKIPADTKNKKKPLLFDHAYKVAFSSQYNAC